MDYAGRIDRIRKEMEKRGVSGTFIASDAGWEYMAGIPRSHVDATKQRQNSAEYAGLFITAKDVVVFVPRLTSLGLIPRIKDNELITKTVIFQDEDLVGKTWEDTLKDMGMNGKTLGVTRDITATAVLFLQERLDASVVNMSAFIDQMRSVKCEEEIALMKEAARITDQIYHDVFPMIRPGTKVRDVELEIQRLLEVYGCSYPSFSAEALNHGPKSGDGVGNSYHTIEKGHMVAFDYGVVYQGYCSDFGRTIFVGEPDKELVKYHELVMASQKAGMEAMKAGKVTGAEVNEASRAVMEAGGCGDYFIHRLGHGIGKDVHERPFLAKGEDTVLQAGMTFTAEPSIFRASRCLIRVEDVVLVTETGYECLNKITKDVVVVD
jgi:Xaa-Pro aminopeptidase